MARSRIIKPEFFQNEDLVVLPPLARLLFIGLWQLADREGRLEDRPGKIKLAVLPADECDIDDLLRQLAEKELIVRYQLGSARYLASTLRSKRSSFSWFMAAPLKRQSGE